MGQRRAGRKLPVTPKSCRKARDCVLRTVSSGHGNGRPLLSEAVAVTAADGTAGLAAHLRVEPALSALFYKYACLFLSYFQVHCGTGKILGPSGFFLKYICQFNELL